MKKIIALVMSLVLIFSLMAGCADTKKPEYTPPEYSSGSKDSTPDDKSPENSSDSKDNETDDTSTENNSDNKSDDMASKYNDIKKSILSDWINHVYALDQLYSSTLWAMSYVEAFGKDQNWDNLQKAKAATWSTVNYLSNDVAPTRSATEEDFDQLISLGYDISFAQIELNQYTDAHRYLLIGCDVIRQAVDLDVFWKPLCDATMKKVLHQKDWYQLMFEYLAVQTDILLLTLGEVDMNDNFDEIFEKYCPHVSASRTFSSDQKELERIYESCIDKGETMLEEYKTLISDTAAANDLLSYAYNTEGHPGLKENLIDIDGLPIVLPIPAWYPESAEDISFFNSNADKKLIEPLPGQELSSKDSGFSMICKGVTADEYDEYLNYLSSINISPDKTEENDGERVSTYYLGDAVMKIYYSNNGASILFLGDICFIPGWYLFKNI